jgi:hypothetical protein
LSEKVDRLAQTAHQFLSGWHQQLHPPTKEEAFLLTLPEAERANSRRSLRRALGSAALAGGAATLDGDALAAYRRFLAGGLVGPAPAGFATEGDLRKKVVGAVRNMFAEASDQATLVFMLQQQQRRRPILTRQGDKIRFAFDASLTDGQNFQVSIAYLVEGDARALEGDTPPHWRLAGIKLLSAMKPSHGRGPGPRPSPRPGS